MKHNVYDFDKTIYDGDSTINFYLYCLLRCPKAVLALPKTVLSFMKYKLCIYEKIKFKEDFYGFLNYVSDIDWKLEHFWDKNQVKIKSWYLTQKQKGDIIISASPQFLLEPIVKRLGVEILIASDVDKKTGKTKGKNCYGEEKVIRLKAEVTECIVDKFYSDSISDRSLANLAEQSYLVKGNKITDWER